jgi:hypothetical protein
MPWGGLLQVAEVGASTSADLIDRWRDLGPALWLVAGAGALSWALLLVVFALATRSRRIDAGPSTLELGGPEPPAVVNLLTRQGRLGHQAVPATLLDLAARRLLVIEQVGGRTLVTVGPDSEITRERASRLEPYERMVLQHVVQRAIDGVVPAEALTTGPETEARGWWRTFRRSVERDARLRGLSRRRWSPLTQTILVVTALAVAVLVAVAASTLPDDQNNADDDPVGVAVAFGVLTAGALLVAMGALNGQRDTAAGRMAASRWLGLRRQLAEDPLFAEYPPAGVAIWDRLLSYGAAMGVAHGAVRAVPLGAERDSEAWSSVRGHWRVVRIRYPRLLPPGYGRHPARAALLGFVQMGGAALAFPVVTALTSALLDLVGEFRSDDTVPIALRFAIVIAVAVVVALGIGLAVSGGLLLASGVADLLTPRRTVEGQVLRVRRKGDDDHPRWYVAVDDGSVDHIRAWRASPGGAAQGATVRASVTRWLGHVRGLEVVAPAPAGLPLPGADEDDEPTSPLPGLLGRVGGKVDVEGQATTAFAPLPAATGPPPPLPDAPTVSAVVGRALALDQAAHPHPMAVGGASVTFGDGDGSTVVIAWADPVILHAHRSMPRLLRRELPGLGSEAYRVTGGGVVVRSGGSVLLVMGRLTGITDRERNQLFEHLARTTLDLSAAM